MLDSPAKEVAVAANLASAVAKDNAVHLRDTVE